MIALSSSTGDLSVATATAGRMVSESVRALAPLLAALAFVSLASSAMVSRSGPNLWALKPRKERVSAKAGMKRMVSAQVVFELLRSVIKLALLAAVTAGVWTSGYEALLAGPGTVDALVGVVRGSVGELLVRVALLAVVVGVIDAKWSRRRFDKQAKMSHQDVREEHKSSDGNPQMKGQIRARAAKLSRSRMLAAIAGADVVLANPTHLVVALTYTRRHRGADGGGQGGRRRRPAHQGRGRQARRAGGRGQAAGTRAVPGDRGRGPGSRRALPRRRRGPGDGLQHPQEERMTPTKGPGRLIQLGVPVLIVCLVLMLVLPLPKALLDLLLATNLTGAVVILLVALMVSPPAGPRRSSRRCCSSRRCSGWR